MNEHQSSSINLEKCQPLLHELIKSKARLKKIIIYLTVITVVYLKWLVIYIALPAVWTEGRRNLVGAETLKAGVPAGSRPWAKSGWVCGRLGWMDMNESPCCYQRVLNSLLWEKDKFDLNVHQSEDELSLQAVFCHHLKLRSSLLTPEAPSVCFPAYVRLWFWVST